MLCVAILLLPQICLGFNHEIPTQHTEESVVKLDAREFEEAMERLRKPRYREVELWVTAYTVGDGSTPSDTMANGEKVHVGAVAYNGVPFGTKVVIGGVEYTVKDRVARDDTVDIYMDSLSQVNQWGRQRITVKILEE